MTLVLVSDNLHNVLSCLMYKATVRFHSSDLMESTLCTFVCTYVADDMEGVGKKSWGVVRGVGCWLLNCR